MLSRRYKMYLLAFVAYTGTLVAMAAMASLVIRYDSVAGLAQLAVALSGNLVGGLH